tara:strand:- start:8337 stop:10043 length:1707 start_codon:yes stop_codon:yes gene_type:complete
MRKLAFDIEANGLNELTVNSKGNPIPEATKVWCLCVRDVDTGESWSFTPDSISDGVELLREADILIGHNIIFYDIPLLERIYGPIDARAYDSLVVSRLMYPDRKNHPFKGNSLECWGKHLGCAKTDYTGGWDAYSQEMLDYCKQDVILSCEIFKAQQDFVSKNRFPVKIEHDVANIISKQIQNGINFDSLAADELEMDLLMEKVLIEDNMQTIFPPIVEERYSDKTGKRLKDKVTHFNPGSRKQIAERLHDKYGWIPPKTDKGNPKVDAAVLKELHFEEAKTLVKYFDVVKLLGMVSDWILRASNSRDNRIHGNVNTHGTVTGRMTASQPNLQQVSGDKRARSLFIPKDGWVQVGIDASGLEARLLANRMFKWDGGEYGDVVINGDIHTTNQQAAGLQSRDQAKTFFYALIYGAGDAKIGKIIDRSAHHGKQIKERFFDNMPALKKLIEKCQFQVAKKGTITLLDGREVPCRSKHSSLNVQLQGDGAIIMKLAQIKLNNAIENNPKLKDNVRFMATVHDEWQLECEPSIAQEVGQLGVRCIEEAGEELGCDVSMDGDFRVGRNWAECH